jgi:glycosyltransferase involved in cell wall biosynthesis
VAREVYGNAVLFAAPGDIAATAETIRRLLTDPSAAAGILRSAPSVLARYSWDSAADRTLEHLERIAAP